MACATIRRISATEPQRRTAASHRNIRTGTDREPLSPQAHPARPGKLLTAGRSATDDPAQIDSQTHLPRESHVGNPPRTSLHLDHLAAQVTDRRELVRVGHLVQGPPPELGQGPFRLQSSGEDIRSGGLSSRNKSNKQLCPGTHRPAIRSTNPRSRRYLPITLSNLHTGHAKRPQRPNA